MKSLKITVAALMLAGAASLVLAGPNPQFSAARSSARAAVTATPATTAPAQNVAKACPMCACTSCGAKS